MAYEAVRIATKFMTPVILLTDGYIANGAEPWLIPESKSLPEIRVTFRTEADGFYPYLRDNVTLSRPWVIPGTPELEHRIGGLEKEHITGNVSYDPENHEFMVKMRQQKVDRIADFIPSASVYGDERGDLLVVGWGGTSGSIRTAVMKKRAEGKSVSHLHLKYINPFQKNVGEILRHFKKILIPELNLGQLTQLIQAKYLVPVIPMSKVQGLPFRSIEIEKKIDEILQ
jgi:2-oxoglutarate ferredoxin oxidoreductase subunit alpha